MAKAKGWRRREGFGKEEKAENDKKIEALEREGLNRLKELFETSPEAEYLREIEGFSIVLSEKFGLSLDVSVVGYEDIMSVGFRYPRGGWDSPRQCTGLYANGRTLVLGRSFGRHYGYDFDDNVVPPATFKKMVKGMGEHIREVMLFERKQRASQRMDDVTLSECQKVLERAGYEVIRRGVILEVGLKKEFAEKFPKSKCPERLMFRGKGNGYLSLGWGNPGTVKLCGHSFSAKLETILQVVAAIENFYDMMYMLDAVEG